MNDPEREAQLKQELKDRMDAEVASIRAKVAPAKHVGDTRSAFRVEEGNNRREP